MRVLIVDDEAPARAQLRRALGSFPDVEIAGEAANGIEALERMEELQPEVVLLDIEMPGMNGIEVAANVGEAVLIVFVTAYDEYAVKAFETHAADYLLKPLDTARLERTVKRLRERLDAGKQPDVAQLLRALQGSSPPSRIAARKGKRILLVPVRDILYVTSEDKLVFLVTRDDRFLVDRTISELEASLEPAGFFRISRAELASVAHITELIPWFSGTWHVRMSDGVELGVSRERARRLKTIVQCGS